MPKLLIATTNAGKLKEIAGILDGALVELITLNDLDPIVEPEETGTTFADNARLKARDYSNATGLVSVADDSGIEIDALDKAPGVHSARWHGTDYPTKFRKIQELFRERRVTGSTARFVCQVALANRDQILFEASGTVEGEIVTEPRGSNGFGYDPMFAPVGHDQTFGELDPERKHEISHRADAFRKLVAALIE